MEVFYSRYGLKLKWKVLQICGYIWRKLWQRIWKLEFFCLFCTLFQKSISNTTYIYIYLNVLKCQTISKISVNLDSQLSTTGMPENNGRFLKGLGNNTYSYIFYVMVKNIVQLFKVISTVLWYLICLYVLFIIAQFIILVN